VNIESVISAFVVPSKRDRYFELLKSKRGTERVRRDLAHFHDFDLRYVLKMESRRQTAQAIQQQLVDLGAPQRCSLFSEFTDRDASNILLKEALEKVVGLGAGAILLCRSGILAYYESEESGIRFILRKG